jgi:hypothetical protein
MQSGMRQRSQCRFNAVFAQQNEQIAYECRFNQRCLKEPQVPQRPPGRIKANIRGFPRRTFSPSVLAATG